jgi:hypothetical protein
MVDLERDPTASHNSGLEHRAIGSAEGEANLGGSRYGSHTRTRHTWPPFSA